MYDPVKINEFPGQHKDQFTRECRNCGKIIDQSSVKIDGSFCSIECQINHATINQVGK